MGFSGEPVPKVTGIGAAVRRNSQRFRPAAAFRERFQVAVVEDGRAHGDQEQLVNRLVHAVHQGRHHVAAVVAADHGDIAAMQPFGAGGVQPGGELSRVPRAFVVAPRPAAGAEKDDIAGADLKAGLLLPGVQVLGVDGRGGFQISDALRRGMSTRIPREKMPFLNWVTAFLVAPLAVIVSCG